jgi:hypothetical protein
MSKSLKGQLAPQVSRGKIESNYLNLFGPALFSLLTVFVMFSVILVVKFAFAEPLLYNSSLLDGTSGGSIYPIIEGTFTIPSDGFQITLPHGWSGIDLSLVAMVSPTGIDSKTGSIKPGGDRVLMVLGRINVSDFVGALKHYNASKYLDSLKKIAETAGCKILSDKFVKINGMKSEKLTGVCRSHGEEKTVSYSFASSKNIIFVGLKGSGLTFDNNLKKFKQSVQTVKINNPRDIEDILSGYSPPTR